MSKYSGMFFYLTDTREFYAHEKLNSYMYFIERAMRILFIIGPHAKIPSNINQAIFMGYMLLAAMMPAVTLTRTTWRARARI